MAGKFQPYSDYKDSGVDWLGGIPSHWDCIKLKYVAELEGNKIESDSIHKYVGMENVESWTGKYLKKQDAQTEGLSTSFSSGDVLFGKLRPYLAKSWLADFSGICSSEFLVLRSEKVSPKFLNYYSLTEEFIKQVDSSTYGSKMPRASWDFISLMRVPVPTDNDSEKIGNFLDHETAKIDTLIDKQQQLIKLLKEKRQAVISHAVTKGLNSKALMHDPCVEWFNELPQHWKVSKLGYHAKISNGATPSRENMAFWEKGNIAWLNSSKVNDVRITKADQFITAIALNQTSVRQVKKHDIVIAITGEGQTRGRVAICMIDATINQHLAAISITDKLLNFEFLFYYLVSQYERIRYESSGAGSTKGAITCADIISFPIVIPSEKEQLEINNYIVNTGNKLDSLIQLAVDQVKLLAERRSALISAAVTGKIDVRNWQVPQAKSSSTTEGINA